MKVSVQPALNDASLDAEQPTNQRQLSVAVSAVGGDVDLDVPLNLCLILDRSGSMGGKPLKIVKQAAQEIIDRMSPIDRVSVVAFDHRAKVLVTNQLVEDPEAIKAAIDGLKASGGTAIDEGMKLGIEELSKTKQDTISQAFLLTDGENEHGENSRCLKLAQLAAEYNITLNGLGFGDHWNQDVLEAIADAGGGTLSYIAQPTQAVSEFARLFDRMQSVGLTNAHLILSPIPEVRLAELKPIAQVAPETIELPVNSEYDGRIAVRLGDLMVDAPRVILANLYVAKMGEGRQEIAQLQVRYDDPATGQTEVLSEPISVTAHVVSGFVPSPDPEVGQYVLALAKYRQTQIAETKLQKGDRTGAATMLQSAAKTALQMGDDGAATILQKSATMLQQGENLSDSDRKKTRIVSKTVLQKPSE